MIPLSNEVCLILVLPEHAVELGVCVHVFWIREAALTVVRILSESPHWSAMFANTSRSVYAARRHPRVDPPASSSSVPQDSSGVQRCGLSTRTHTSDATLSPPAWAFSVAFGLKSNARYMKRTSSFSSRRAAVTNVCTYHRHEPAIATDLSAYNPSQPSERGRKCLQCHDARCVILA